MKKQSQAAAFSIFLVAGLAGCPSPDPYYYFQEFGAESDDDAAVGPPPNTNLFVHPWVYVSGMRSYTCTNGTRGTEAFKGTIITVQTGGTHDLSILVDDCTLSADVQSMSVAALAPSTQVCASPMTTFAGKTYTRTRSYSNFALTTSDGETMTDSIASKAHYDDGAGVSFDCNESASGALKVSP